jgi:AbiJ N-terminal domain 4
LPRFRLRSRRQRQPEENPDVYQYDVLPEAFRRQVVYILLSTLGTYDSRYNSNLSSLSEPSANRRWRTLLSRFAEEIGEFQLSDRHNNPFAQCSEYVQTAPTQQTLDFIDLAFHYIDFDLRRDTEYHFLTYGEGPSKLDEAIEKLNQRFEEHRLGYQFQDGQLIKRTDQYVHEEVVLPALTLLSDPRFRGAQEEFLSAHRHYREQRYREAIADALKAFESTMKSILDERGWEYDRERDTANTLIRLLFERQLIPSMLQSQFSNLRGLLESGLLPVRNRMAGHGQGAEPVPVPKYVAEYALHLAAANIVFLVHANEAYAPDNR